MTFYAHTAEGEDGWRLAEKHWQPLAQHLCNVARMAKEFAAPLDPAAEAEAELAGQVLVRQLRSLLVKLTHSANISCSTRGTARDSSACSRPISNRFTPDADRQDSRKVWGLRGEVARLARAAVLALRFPALRAGYSSGREFPRPRRCPPVAQGLIWPRLPPSLGAVPILARHHAEQCSDLGEPVGPGEVARKTYRPRRRTVGLDRELRQLPWLHGLGG